MLDIGTYNHCDYGEVIIDEHCLWLQKNNDNPESVFVRKHGELIEVAERLLEKMDDDN